MSKPIVSEGVDNGSNTFNIFYDENISMVYLAAKVSSEFLPFLSLCIVVHYIAVKAKELKCCDGVSVWICAHWFANVLTQIWVTFKLWANMS